MTKRLVVKPQDYDRRPAASRIKLGGAMTSHTQALAALGRALTSYAEAARRGAKVADELDLMAAALRTNAELADKVAMLIEG